MGKAEILNTDRVLSIAVKSSPILSVVLLVMLSLAFPASAHVPLMAGGNENISSAMHITDPGKSWAVYGSLEKDVVHYYSFDLEEGERIYLSLFKSSDAKEKDFLPALVLLGPGLNDGRTAAGAVGPAAGSFRPENPDCGRQERCQCRLRALRAQQLHRIGRDKHIRTRIGPLLCGGL